MNKLTLFFILLFSIAVGMLHSVEAHAQLSKHDNKQIEIRSRELGNAGWRVSGPGTLSENLAFIEERESAGDHCVVGRSYDKPTVDDAIETAKFFALQQFADTELADTKVGKSVSLTEQQEGSPVTNYSGTFSVQLPFLPQTISLIREKGNGGFDAIVYLIISENKLNHRSFDNGNLQMILLMDGTYSYDLED